MSLSKFSQDDVVHGRFKLIKKLGSGSAAVVFRAKDLVRNQEVAVKLFAVRSSQLSTEISTMKLLGTSKHWPTLYDFEYFGPGMLALSLEGKTVDSLISRAPRQTLDPPLVLRITEQALLGLSELHSRGFAHRDVHEGNLALGLSRGKAPLILIDMGFCRLFRRRINSSKSMAPRVDFATGTMCSYAVSRGAQPERHDDIHSLAHVMLHMRRAVDFFNPDQAKNQMTKYRLQNNLKQQLKSKNAFLVEIVQDMLAVNKNNNFDYSPMIAKIRNNKCYKSKKDFQQMVKKYLD